MMTDSCVFRQLIDRWLDESNTPLEPPVQPDELRQLFAAHGFHLTQDLSDLYALVGGMPPNYADDSMFELWCRDRIEEGIRRSSWDYVWFGDWLYGSHLYAVKPVNERHSAVYIDYVSDRITAPQLIAESVYEFGRLLMIDPHLVGAGI